MTLRATDEHPDKDVFATKLAENGAEVAKSFAANLLQIIQRMRPPKRKAKARASGGSASKTKSGAPASAKAAKVIPNIYARAPFMPARTPRPGRRTALRELIRAPQFPGLASDNQGKEENPNVGALDISPEHKRGKRDDRRVTPSRSRAPLIRARGRR